MTIAKKLYWGFGGMIALVVMLGLANLGALLREHAAKKNTNRSFQLLRETSSLQYQLSQNQIHLNNYLLSGDASEAEKVLNGAYQVDDAIHHTEANATVEERVPLDRLNEAEHDWLERFALPLIQKRKQVDAGNATVADLQIFYLQQNPADWLKNVKDPIDQTMAATEEVLLHQQSSDGIKSTLITWLTSFLALSAFTGGLVIASKTNKSITDPLMHLIQVAREIGDSGDLDQKIDIERRDEVGELGKSFNKMIAYLKEMAAVSEAIAGGDLTLEVQPRSKNDTLGEAFLEMTIGLRQLVKSVRDSASQVTGGSNEVASASDESAKINVQAASAIDEVTSTMHEMSINVQNMVKNTQTQASSVSETSASIDQMVASIQRVADTAKVLLDISQRSREEVHTGIQTMEKATDGLNRIHGSIQNSSHIIGALGTRANEIGKIVEVIDDLAEQTNLLALNAAIEAARAGEHGLGFAVVADEVRKLAEKSAQSTREISDVIESIQKEARRAVDNMEKSTTIVNDGLTQGTDLSTALKKISNVVTEVYKFAQEIGAATNEQSHGSSQIAKATTRLNEITHEINSSVEEQASGAQAVVRAMEKMRELIQRSTSGSTELAASAEQMSKMSRSLLDSMDRFVIESVNGNGHHRAKSNVNSRGDERKNLSRYATTTS
ncbi:MAG TPA: methyl-accepting chemotaxis protein [Terriglobales bacterium]|jgi:methyl-accepting chemotaxis protein|nr:methyl-accepting chemotaxis protein [Terriglobales bacterium]